MPPDEAPAPSTRLVLVTAGAHEPALDRLRALSPDLRVVRSASSRDVSDDLWQQVEVLYTFQQLPANRTQAPRLRWVQLHLAGVEGLLSHPLLADSADVDGAPPVLFTTASGVHAVSIAEYVFSVLLAWSHRVPRMLEWHARGTWPADEQRWPLFVPDELWGKTVGIVGYGSIGRHVARIARAFGMRVLAMQRGTNRRDTGFVLPGTGDPQGTLPEQFYRPDQLRDLLGSSDVVVIAVPVTPATTGLIDEAAFRAMRPGAFLVNVARGSVLDEMALLRAVREEWIGGAALDVASQEPLPEGHPLWGAPNLLMSPHVSGFSPRYDERALDLFVQNMRQYLAGETLLNLVDARRGY